MVKFEVGKRYVFSKELHRKIFGDDGANWVKLCDGKEVEVEDDKDGVIRIKGREYLVSPRWCKEVKERQMLTDEQAVTLLEYMEQTAKDHRRAGDKEEGWLNGYHKGAARMAEDLAAMMRRRLNG